MARKDFQKGMVAGAEPFVAKFQQQAEAVENIGRRVEEGLVNISAVQNVILGDLSAREKKELYDLNTYVDISELEDTEKELLMAIIYTLSDMTEEVTEEQQAYIRSVRAYLNATEVQILPDLEIIENIDSKSVEKAILQCVMEFFFLENCDHGYRDEYADVLGYFSIKEKEIEKIIANINTIYKAIGAIGLGEKYGYVPVEDEELGGKDFADEHTDISAISNINEKVVFKLIVEDIFSILGQGTVAQGTIEKGTVKDGDKVELQKSDGTKKITEIRGIEKNRNFVSSARVGDTVGLLLKGIIRSDIERGDIIIIVQS